MAFNNNPYDNRQYRNTPYCDNHQQQPRNLFPSLWTDPDELARATGACLARVFIRMFVALLVTAAVAYGVYQTPAISHVLLANFPLFIAMMGVQVILVLALSAKVMTMSPVISNIMFFIYAIITGLSISFIFIIYPISTIFQAFAISALMFGAMAIYGTITRRDLTGLGSFLFMALIGLIIASVINMFFWGGDTMFMLLNYAGVLIFVGLTAYHTQRIKKMLEEANEASCEDAIKKISVIGALSLYLSFINIFLRVLTILGRRR